MNRPRYKEPTSEEIVDRQFLVKDQYDNLVINDDGKELVGAVLDNASTTKRNLGKMIYGAQLGIGIEQLLHPDVGAAVEYTGKFWANPYKRIADSLNPIMAVVLSKNPYTAGDHVRRLHSGINGTDQNGRKINALNPDTFYWTHNTFHNGNQRTAAYYSIDPYTDEDRAQQHFESVTWYSYYGMPMNMVPATHDDNLVYEKYIIDDVLEMNPSAERAIDAALNHNPPRPEAVPKAVWLLAKFAVAPVAEVVGLVTIGEMDPAIRAKFSIPFSASDQKHLDDIRNIAKVFIDQMPDPLRYSPMAYDALLRERGEHKNLADRMIYKGLSLGAVAAKRTVIPIFKRTQSAEAKVAA
jgi:uncharacterized protein (DUF2236 family)